MKLRRYIFTIILFALSSSGYGKVNSDSLWNIWNDETKEAQVRINSIDLLIINDYLFVKPDSAFVLGKMMHALAVENQLDKNIGGALMIMGASYYFRSNYDSALKYYNLSLNHFLSIDEKRGQASTLGNIANVLTDQGNFQKGIEYYSKSLNLHESLGNKRGQATQLMNIGLIYYAQSEYLKAIEYYNRSLSFHKEEDFKYGISDCLINIGDAYAKLGDIDKSQEIYKKCLKIHDTIDDGQGKAILYNSIGENYTRLKDYSRALEHFDLALDIQRQMGDKNYEAATLILKGNVYAKQNQLLKSNSNLESGLKIAQNIGAVQQIRDASKFLYENYKSTGQSQRSLSMLEQYITMRDSIDSEENQRGLIRQEYKYDYEKQAIADSLDFAKKQAIKDLELEKQEANLAKQRIALGATGAGLLLLLALAYSIRKGKKRSDELLLNILPAEVAEELKKKGYSDAKEFEQATVLFTDFKNFTSISEKMNATELVQEINNCYKAFDQIMEKYSIEKIKTIGDAYMAAGGLPVPTDDSIKNTVLAAIEMQEFMAQGSGLRAQGSEGGERKAVVGQKTEGRQPTADSRLFEMRVGIHTGPVVAGIVGIKKFQYDIWGDTVNTASRAESASEVGKVNITADTYERIKDEPEFTFQKRGQIEAKGKGAIEMYFVTVNGERLTGNG